MLEHFTRPKIPKEVAFEKSIPPSISVENKTNAFMFPRGIKYPTL